MQTISAGYENRSKNHIRRPSLQVLIDWNLDGNYDDETDYVLSLEGERTLSQPLGGVHQAQADITLSNVTKRFSPSNSDSPIADYIKLNRRIKILTGFNGENIAFITGFCEIPEIDDKKQQVTIHLWDELEYLSNYKLTGGGELYLDIRVDIYIWEILDTVYANYFTVIASFDSDETITGGTVDAVNMRGGDQAILLEATSGGTDSCYKTISLNLGSYANTDIITLFAFIDNVDNLDSMILRLHTTDGVNYGSFELTNYDLVTGWNQLEIPKGDVATTGSFSWASLVKAEIIIDAVAAQDVDVIIDELRIVEALNYPLRVFDVGLQNIPAAGFSSNTALFEIKSAAEAEGGRFYADEDGKLHYENRQFYNNNEDSKASVHGFDFDRIIKLEYPKGVTQIINSIRIKVNPRQIVAEKEVWRLGEVPQIANATTLTIWSSLIDPVPVTAAGLVTPVSTTDYLANDQSDGLGTNRTASISIVTTKFTDGAKLEITNNHSSPVYLTLMKLRGTPAEIPAGDGTNIIYKDQTSIDENGEQKLSPDPLELKYLASTSYAQSLAEQLVEWYKDRVDRLRIDNPALPQLQIGDMVGLENGYTGENQIMRKIGESFKMGNGAIFQEKTELRAIGVFETLTFFTIGTSTIGGTDVIAP